MWLGTSLGFLLGAFLSSKSMTWAPWLAGTSVLTYHLWMAWEWVRILQDSMQINPLVIVHLVVRVMAFYANTFALRFLSKDEMILVNHTFLLFTAGLTVQIISTVFTASSLALHVATAGLRCISRYRNTEATSPSFTRRIARSCGFQV